MNPTEVIGLVMLAMRKIDPSSIALFDPSIAAPWLEKWTISPSRLIRICAFGNLPESRYRSFRNAGMRLRRAASKPCFSGAFISIALPYPYFKFRLSIALSGARINSNVAKSCRRRPAIAEAGERILVNEWRTRTRYRPRSGLAQGFAEGRDRRADRAGQQVRDGDDRDSRRADARVETCAARFGRVARSVTHAWRPAVHHP